MKTIAAVLALLLAFALTGCTQPPEPTQAPTEPAQTEPVRTGWQEENGRRCYLDASGEKRTGWLNEGGARYYLDESGFTLNGWQELEGKRFYFREDGCAATGWLTQEEGTYYLGMDGALVTGLMNIDGNGYYFDENGLRHSGWLTLEDNTYHFDEEGIMAVGPREIEGQMYYFSPRGVHVLLVNPWNYLPEGYDPELVNVTGQDRMEATAAEALERMLADCKAAGYDYIIASAYRTQSQQEYLFRRKVNFYLDKGYSQENAEVEAAKTIAIPGTSEHQLGLAVDLTSASYPYLENEQADTATQKWFMAHCHEYGFILRYPKDTTHITGIIWEPWHYRYVGTDIAREITNLGVTLEEYLGAAATE